MYHVRPHGDESTEISSPCKAPVCVLFNHRTLCRRQCLVCLLNKVPPYSRAGLYKQLATLKDLLREFREDPVKNASLRPVIAATMQQAGLYEDLPFPSSGEGEGGVLTAEAAEELPAEGAVRHSKNRLKTTLLCVDREG